MEMKKFIEMGEKKAGSQAKLAEIIDTRYTTLVAVKAGKKSLTTATCMLLAQYIGVEEVKVISASNLIIEKDEKRRKIFENYLKETDKAASFVVAALFLAVISITSPNPANASQATISNGSYIYYVK